MWIDAWEWQCCGDPFAIGDETTFTVTDHGDREFLAAVLGNEMAERIDAFEEHHLDDDSALLDLAGSVRSIEAAWCRYEQTRDVLRPVPGTTEVRPVSKATGWEQEDGDVHFVGYIVTLGP